MNSYEERLEQELNDLRREIEEFTNEKEKVRKIVGGIGGVPTFNTKLFNVIFAIAVMACLVISLISTGTVRLAMLELGVVFISIKLIYIMHNQASVNHFELWILSSIE